MERVWLVNFSLYSLELAYVCLSAGMVLNCWQTVGVSGIFRSFRTLRRRPVAVRKTCSALCQNLPAPGVLCCKRGGYSLG